MGQRHTARSLALQILLDCRRHDAFLQEILDQQLSRNLLQPADRRLATQLAYGVSRRRGTLEALLQPLVNRPARQVEPWIWDALELGAYQVAFLSHIPAHAALHETVELASEFGRPGAKGFLNGVLRALAALVTPEQSSGPAADALPLEAGAYRRLAKPVLPDPAANPVEYLASGFSLPRWLAQRWFRRFGEEECRRLGFWFAAAAPLAVRCNRLRLDRQALLDAWSQAGVAAEPGELPEAVRLGELAPIRELPGYQEGWFTVQDESAMRVARALAPEPGANVLDLCAAPGGKATHLAELMNNQGRVVACDTSSQRLNIVGVLAERLGIGILERRAIDPEQMNEAPQGPFDGVLIDAPCSNTGVLGRRPEVRWRLKPGELPHLANLQHRLLRIGASRVKPGGALVYSTCSIEPEENRQVVQGFLKEHTGFRLEAEEESVPGRPGDGGYWARVRLHG
jgi:16S rRNA (cytosine967-C5)-methyltransferase